MNEFHKSLQIDKSINKSADRFYKIYEKSKEGRKIYKGRTIKEAGSNYYLGGVSCFIIDDEGNILIEKRANTNITSGEYDLCSGHIDSNETSTQAMIREYVEELHKGTKKEQEEAKTEAIDNLIKLDELDLSFDDNYSKRKFFIQFYALKTKLKHITIQKEEVDSIKWLNMEEAFEMIRQNKTKFPYDKRYEKLFEKVKEIYLKNEIENEI